MRIRSEPPCGSLRPEPVADEMLDLRGLKCPMPVLRTRRALAKAAPGTRFEVCCTDPLASLDIPHLVRETGDVLLSITRHEGETRFRIAKAETQVRRAPEDPSVAADVVGTQ